MGKDKGFTFNRCSGLTPFNECFSILSAARKSGSYSLLEYSEDRWLGDDGDDDDGEDDGDGDDGDGVVFVLLR